MTYYNRYIKPNRVASSYGTTLPTGGVVFIPFLRINYFSGLKDNQLQLTLL